MKEFLFGTNLCTGVTANAEDGSFPASNLLTGRIGQLFKGTSNVATLTCTVSQAADVICFHNTNAATIVITVKDTAEVDTLVAASTKTLSVGTNFLLGNSWYDFGTQAEAMHIIAVLTSAVGTIIECGQVFAQTGFPCPGANPGMTEDISDRSFVQILNDGQKYIHSEDRVRFFSGSFLLNRTSTALYEFSRWVQLQGQTPTSILISSADYEDWSIWGHISPLKTRHVGHNFSEVSLTIEEAIQTLRAQ